MADCALFRAVLVTPTFLQGQERPEVKGHSRRAKLESLWFFDVRFIRGVREEKVELALKIWGVGGKYNENSVIKRNLGAEILGFLPG